MSHKVRQGRHSGTALDPLRAPFANVQLRGDRAPHASPPPPPGTTSPATKAAYPTDPLESRPRSASYHRFAARHGGTWLPGHNVNSMRLTACVPMSGVPYLGPTLTVIRTPLAHSSQQAVRSMLTFTVRRLMCAQPSDTTKRAIHSALCTA